MVGKWLVVCSDLLSNLADQEVTVHACAGRGSNVHIICRQADRQASGVSSRPLARWHEPAGDPCDHHRGVMPRLYRADDIRFLKSVRGLKLVVGAPGAGRPDFRFVCTMETEIG